MLGTILHPLNEMRSHHPDLFNAKIQKYHGRESVMEQTVGILNCKWNDVIHLTPLDPKETLRALQAAGGKPSSASFWKIPVEMLDEDSTVYFTYKISDTGLEKEYFKFSKDSYEEMKAVPERTFEYYQYMFSQGKNPLMYHLVPHILTLKPIDTTSLEIYSWS
jgi:hypothetical protein